MNQRDAEWLTCSSVHVLLVRFDAVGETHLRFHTRRFASAVLALILGLLQVDLNGVEGHVGTELGNISGPGGMKQISKKCNNYH